MIPRVTRGIIRNFDSDYQVDFNHIINSSGHTVYTFDSEMVYNFQGEPIWRITKDAIVDLEKGENVYTFSKDLILDSNGVIRYKIIPGDFPNLCSLLGKVFLCSPEGEIVYILGNSYVSDSKGKKLFSISGTRYRSLEDPDTCYEIDGDIVRDNKWNVYYKIHGNKIFDTAGNHIYTISD